MSPLLSMSYDLGLLERNKPDERIVSGAFANFGTNLADRVILPLISQKPGSGSCFLCLLNLWSSFWEYSSKSVK